MMHELDSAGRSRQLESPGLDKKNIRGYVSLFRQIFSCDNRGMPLNLNSRNSGRSIIINKDVDAIEVETRLRPSKIKDLIESIDDALPLLSPREEKAIRLYFALDRPEGKQMTLKDISKEFENLRTGRKGLARDGARHLLHRGLLKLKYSLRGGEVIWKRVVHDNPYSQKYFYRLGK